MTLVEEEVDPRLLELDRVVVGRVAEHFDPVCGDLDAAGRPGIGLDGSDYENARLVCDPTGDRVPCLVVHVVPGCDDLGLPGTIADDEKRDLPAGAMISHPTADPDGFANVICQGTNRGRVGHEILASPEAVEDGSGDRAPRSLTNGRRIVNQFQIVPHGPRTAPRAPATTCD